MCEEEVLFNKSLQQSTAYDNSFANNLTTSHKFIKIVIGLKVVTLDQKNYIQTIIQIS